MNEVTCPRCGNTDVVKHGFQLFANPPHKRQRYLCKNETCAHNFILVSTYVPDKKCNVSVLQEPADPLTGGDIHE